MDRSVFSVEGAADATQRTNGTDGTFPEVGAIRAETGFRVWRQGDAGRRAERVTKVEAAGEAQGIGTKRTQAISRSAVDVTAVGW